MMQRLMTAWKYVGKKWTTWVNALIATGALVYASLSENMREDLGPEVVAVLAGLAILNVYLGNIRQSNIPAA